MLEFAVCELSKIVEDSFDDVLLELRKTERENEELVEKLCGVAEENGVGDKEISASQGDRLGSPNSTNVLKDEEKPDEEERAMTQNTAGTCSSPTSLFSVCLFHCQDIKMSVCVCLHVQYRADFAFALRNMEIT